MDGFHTNVEFCGLLICSMQIQSQTVHGVMIQPLAAQLDLKTELNCTFNKHGSYSNLRLFTL